MSCTIVGVTFVLLGETFPPPDNSLSRWAPLIFAAIGGAALLVATALYVHSLKRSHQRLLADLESQLADRRRVDEALRVSEAFYHSLVESLPQSILRKDREG